MKEKETFSVGSGPLSKEGSGQRALWVTNIRLGCVGRGKKGRSRGWEGAGRFCVDVQDGAWPIFQLRDQAAEP